MAPDNWEAGGRTLFGGEYIVLLLEWRAIALTMHMIELWFPESCVPKGMGVRFE